MIFYAAHPATLRTINSERPRMVPATSFRAGPEAKQMVSHPLQEVYAAIFIDAILGLDP